MLQAHPLSTWPGSVGHRREPDGKAETAPGTNVQGARWPIRGTSCIATMCQVIACMMVYGVGVLYLLLQSPLRTGHLPESLLQLSLTDVPDSASNEKHGRLQREMHYHSATAGRYRRGIRYCHRLKAAGRMWPANCASTISKRLRRQLVHSRLGS